MNEIQIENVIDVFKKNGFVGLRQYMNTNNGNMYLEGLYQPKRCKYVMIFTIDLTTEKWSSHHVDEEGQNYMRIKNKDSMMMSSKMGDELWEVLNV